MARRSTVDPIPLTDWVVVTHRDPGGRLLSRRRYANTITAWTRTALANYLIEQPLTIGSGTTLAPTIPRYIALGTGTTPVSDTDVTMFAEGVGTRKPYSYRSTFQAFTAQISVNYAVGTAVGTWNEAGLWDQASTATTLSAPASAGATSLSVTSAPAVYGGTQAGQYTTAYIADGTDSETVALAQTYAAGAATWTLQAPLQYAHASGVAITVFAGNLWAHVSFGSGGETQPSQGSVLTIQWSLAIQAS